MTSVNISSTTNTVTVTGEGDTAVVTVSTVGPQGPSGSSGTLVELTDVEATSRVDGSVLIYDGTTAKFVAGPLDTKLTLADGGNF